MLAKHIHYYTDDTVCHPLARSYLAGELKKPGYTLDLKTTSKDNKYRASLAPARLHPAVLMRQRVICYRTTAYTSLGDLNDGAAKDINCAARFFKLRMERDILRQPRADGKSADTLAAAFRAVYRTRLQIAIAVGNSIIARAVGI